jgi:non-specific serine/threonine protein kinase/serine/threonine-protein kinase
MSAAPWCDVKAVLGRVLEAPPAERPALLDRLCGGDSGLRRSVEEFLDLEERADSVFNSALAPGAALRTEEAAPETIGHYRIVRLLGRGGMGAVYLGERDDGEYRKQVAIKLIAVRWHDGVLERAFRRERQILAQLDHPGIARLLDGGSTPDGQPYFVMEYVEGLPLPACCESQRLDPRGCLDLFLRVCDAVQYAHHRLIVHRDLKPGNILVTAEGEAKLLDFGLARVADAAAADRELTQTGLHAMTPAYASPEQIRGEPFTVASDVYSLGVILYEILAGRRPYRRDGSLAELARAIAEDEPVPLLEAAAGRPVRWRRALKGDLERIVAKALAKQPAERYASVADLAGDLRRHLAGLPVSARPATFRYRAAKLLRRHRVAIPAAAAALCLILAFAGAAVWEARRAERRFNQVRGIAHTMMFELHDAIQHLPGSTAARALLVKRGLEYLENLSRDAGGNPALMREVALGYERIGMIQGFQGEANLGQLPASLDSFRKAEQMLSALAGRRPHDEGLRQDYLRVCNEFAVLLASTGQVERSRELVRRNIASIRAALSATPNDSGLVEALAVAQGHLGDSYTDQQRYAEAIPIYEEALELMRRTAALRPGNDNTVRNLALSSKRLAALYGTVGRTADSRRLYEAARDIDEARLARHPSDTQAMLDLSYDLGDLGWLAGHTGEYQAALALYRRVLDLRTAAAKADPNDHRAAAALASAVYRTGVALRRVHEPRESLGYLERAAAMWESELAGQRQDVEVVHDLAEDHDDIAAALLDLHTPQARARAAGEYRSARRLYEDLRDRDLLPRSYFHRIDEWAAAERSALTPAAR